MFDTGDGAVGAGRGGPRNLVVVLLVADVAIWVAASTMLFSYGL